MNRGDANVHLRFPLRASTWRKSALRGRRTSPFISTEAEEGNRFIKLHQDGGSSGRPLPRPASKLPRTVLSATNAAESPTALITKQEMRSWHLLQLEPIALHQPDAFTAPATLEPDGSHLASTPYHLAGQNGYVDGTFSNEIADRTYAQVPVACRNSLKM